MYLLAIVGNLTYSPALVCVIVFYVIYYACTVLRMYIIYSELCFVNTLCDLTVFVNSN